MTSLTCYFCVRLTDNMMCNLAVELAMTYTTSTVDTEDGPILNKIEIGLLVPVNLMVSWHAE